MYAQGGKKESYSSNSRYQTIDSINLFLDSAKAVQRFNVLKASEYINKAIEISIRKGDKQNEAIAYHELGKLQQSTGQHDLALDKFRKSNLAFSRFVSISSKDVKRTKNIYSDDTQELIFLNHLFAAKSHDALNQLNEAERSIRACLGDEFYGLSNRQLAEANRVEAGLMSKRGKYDAAINQLTAVLKQEKAEKNVVGEIETLLLLGSVSEQKGSFSASIDFYTQAKNRAEQARLSDLEQKAHQKLAGIYQNKGMLSKEIDARQNSIGLNSRISSRNVVVDNEEYVIKETPPIKSEVKEKELLITESQFDKITQKPVGNLIEYKVLQPKQDIIVSKENAESYRRLAEVYIQKNDFVKALESFRQYALLQDSLQTYQTKVLEDAIVLSTNIGKNEQRIEMLEQDRMLNEKSMEILQQDTLLKQQQLRNQNIIITSMGLGFLLFLAASIVFIRNNLARRKADKLLTLQSLGGQMNPHFIFNALNSVNEYISTNDERAANRYLSDFSKLMRSVLDDSRHSFIPLTEELNMLKLYLQLEHARFKTKFNYHIHIAKGIENADFYIPPMIVQPFVENAVWHGLRYLDHQGELNVSFEQQGENLIIVISDNGIGIVKSKELKTTNQKKQNSMGMKNVLTRINLINDLYKTNISVDVSDADRDLNNSGTTVRLIIPQKEEPKL